MDNLNIPPTITTLAGTINELPKQYAKRPRAYLVGGFVRDYLLGQESTDVDIEVYGASYNHLKALLQKLFGEKVTEVGKTFAILKVRINNFDIDIALPRTELKTGVGYHGFRFTPNPSLTFKQAGKRRDFTVNAMLMDPLTKAVFDPYNGRKDLKAKKLRVVNPKTFVQDPLRLYRALQLVARYNFSVETQTLKLLKQMARSTELSALSKARINREWQKFYQGKFQRSGAGLAKQIGITVPPQL